MAWVFEAVRFAAGLKGAVVSRIAVSLLECVLEARKTYQRLIGTLPGALVCLICTSHSLASETKPEELSRSSFQVIYDISYLSGLDAGAINLRQTLDLYRPDKPHQESALPVIIYLHAGGWAFGDKKTVSLKPGYFTNQGFAFISMNYRLRWDYQVYDQAVDLISVISWLQRTAAEYGLDTSRVVLMGHEAGGHLASLVATDDSYLRAEGLDPALIMAVVSIDSSSYDIPRLMRELGGFRERRLHELVFGREEKAWQAASPISHVAGDDTLPAFALLFNPEDEASALQAKYFARGLVRESVAVVMIPGSREHPEDNDELLGKGDNTVTASVMTFLRSQL